MNNIQEDIKNALECIDANIYLEQNQYLFNYNGDIK